MIVVLLVVGLVGWFADRMAACLSSKRTTVSLVVSFSVLNVRQMSKAASQASV